MSHTAIDDEARDLCWKVRKLCELWEPLYMLQQSLHS